MCRVVLSVSTPPPNTHTPNPNSKLYHFKYMLPSSDAFIPVATTRPETILGDTAVCVHPDDPRWVDIVCMYMYIYMCVYIYILMYDESSPETILGDTAVCVYPDDPR